MKKYKRIFLIVLDSLGIGNAHDAKKFDDDGSNTLFHIVEKNMDIKMPTLESITT